MREGLTREAASDLNLLETALRQQPPDVSGIQIGELEPMKECARQVTCGVVLFEPMLRVDALLHCVVAIGL